MNWLSLPKPIAAGALIFGIALFMSNSIAHQTSDIDAIIAANRIFETAVSTRDIAAVEKVWLHEDSVNNVEPQHTAFDVGWNATKRSFEKDFVSSLVIASSMGERQIHVNGKVAWVNGVENGLRLTSSGEKRLFTNFVTTIFLNQNGRWLVVSRHVSAMGGEPPPLTEAGPG